MKIYELLKKEKSQRDDKDLEDFMCALAYQYGLSLKMVGDIKSKKDLDQFSHHEIAEAFLEQEIEIIGDGEYLAKFDAKTDPLVIKFKRSKSN